MPDALAADLARFEVPADAWPDWAAVAPEAADAGMTITRPAGALGAAKDWGRFATEVAAWKTAFEAYAGVADVAAIVATLTRYAGVTADAGWSALAGADFPATARIAIAGWRAGLPALAAWIHPAAGARNGTVAFTAQQWSIPAGAFAIAASDRLRALVARAPSFPRGDLDVAAVLLSPYLGLLRERDRTLRLQRDATPCVGGLPAVSATLPAELVAAAAAHADAVPAPIEVVQIVTITAGTPPLDVASAGRGALVALVTALEGFTVAIDGVDLPLGTAEAIAAIAGIEETGTGLAELPLGHQALADAGIAQALADLAAVAGVSVATGDPERVTLRRPPLTPEITAVRTASAPLADFVAGLAREGVFGAGRQPSLRVRRGLAAARRQGIGREAP